MDILSHGLWGTVYAKVANKKLADPIRYHWAFWWGIFPDFFAFAPAFIWNIYEVVVLGQRNRFGPPSGEIEPWHPGTGSMSDFTQLLYSISHSIIIFVAVFALVWFVLRRPPWVMIPWVLHIIMDIPTHSYKFYPTPIFWPLWNWKFLHGISWAQGWFMALNYGTLLILYFVIRYAHGRP